MQPLFIEIEKGILINLLNVDIIHEYGDNGQKCKVFFSGDDNAAIYNISFKKLSEIINNLTKPQ